MEIPFKLVIGIATPIILGKLPPTLDALLSAAVFKATGLMEEDTLPHIPLAREQGIFKASSLFFPARHSYETVGRVMALRGAADLDMDLFQPNGRGQRYVKIDPKRDDYKINMSAYQGIRTTEVYFWGVGDPDRCVALIQDYIVGIGKRSNAGAGQITTVHWEDSEDHSWITPAGGPARSLPLALWREIAGDQPATTGRVRVTLPYWGSEPVLGVFPAALTI